MANNFSIAATADSIAAAAEPQVGTPAINKTTLLFILMAVVGVGAGVYAFAAGHHVAYANTREMPWGILISSYAFFAITSTGLCLLAALSHIFGGNKLAPLANRMVFLSIVTIVAAFAIIGFEIENPWRMAIYNITSPNLTSNIWWMGTLYGMAVGFMLLEFFLILTARYKLAVTLGVMGALAEVMANTNLGAVFATLSSHPFWFGSQLPVFFLASAFMSGAAAIILFTQFAHKMRGEEMSADTFLGVQGASKVLAGLLFLLAVSTAWRFISCYVGGVEASRIAAESLISGPLATNFWLFEVIVGLVFPLVVLVGSSFRSTQAMSTAALMALVGGFFQRYDLVVAGQLVPQYLGWDNLPTYFSYVPSVSEFLVTMAGFGVVGAGFLLGERFFGRAFRHSGEH
ncbi:MAG: polysulfide reductase NrfD [Proteobacteria bacterium]|nr:polysulfide reductase NrfD [Pseudomonadota bacterium]MBU1715597.1 polysulfide reductase NrfD [Pseudomonadota bacterium]